jgi:hypothetical protein
VHFWCDTWQGIHYYLTSEDYICHILLATTITYRFCFLVRIKSEKCHWKLYSCFHAFALCDIYTGMVTGMLQFHKTACSYYLGSRIMGNFPSYCTTRIFPDKTIKSTVKRKLSLGTCCGLMAELCHIWTIMSRESDTMCMSRPAKPDFQKPLWYDNRMKTKIFTQILEKHMFP